MWARLSDVRINTSVSTRPITAIAAPPRKAAWKPSLSALVSADGSPPAYFITTILSFRDEQGARDALASEGGRALAADVPNFTSVKPLVQFNTAVP